MFNYLIKDLNEDEKPREKLLLQGAEYLSDSELLALILRSGGKNISALTLAKQVLTEVGSIHKLISCDIEQIKKIKHIDKAKATALKAACELALRINTKVNILPIEIRNPEDAYNLIKKDIFEKDKEYLFLICLNSRNNFISKSVISVGTVNEALVHPREVYKKALMQNAVSIILIHNHPSNNPDPSSNDIKVTERIASAGNEIGIPLVDHIIACTDTFVSMKALNLFSNKKFDRKGGEKSAINK